MSMCMCCVYLCMCLCCVYACVLSMLCLCVCAHLCCVCVLYLSMSVCVVLLCLCMLYLSVYVSMLCLWVCVLFCCVYVCAHICTVSTWVHASVSQFVSLCVWLVNPSMCMVLSYTLTSKVTGTTAYRSKTLWLWGRRLTPLKKTWTPTSHFGVSSCSINKIRTFY